MTKFFSITFKLINIIVVLFLLLACLIPYLPPGKYWMIAVLGLVFPALFVIVTIFLVVWIIGKSRWALLSLIALIMGFQQISVIAGLHSNENFKIIKPATTLRVLSWNVSSWSETNKSNDYKIQTRQLMLDLIKRQEPDVVCLQEFWDKEYHHDNYSILQLFKEMGYPYSHFVRSYLEDKNLKMGVAIVSKYPITDSAKFNFGEGDFAEHLIYADIKFNNQQIRIFTTHLQSVRLDYSEYSAISKIKHQDESGLNDSKTIVHKLKNAYGYREAEADFVREKIRECPIPAIICGDFNDVPNSYTYFTIKGNLQDAFLRRGTGLGKTFQYLSPTLRIDYILADKKFKVEQYNRIKVNYSDHYPIVADLTAEF